MPPLQPQGMQMYSHTHTHTHTHTVQSVQIKAVIRPKVNS